MRNVMFTVLLALGLGCVYQHRYCDDRTGACYVCDNVGCTPASPVPVADSAVTPVVDSGVLEDTSPPAILDTGAPIVVLCGDTGISCVTRISRCVDNACRVTCTSVADCLRVDNEYVGCSAEHYCTH